jgi:hypothetical protein
MLQVLVTLHLETWNLKPGTWNNIFPLPFPADILLSQPACYFGLVNFTLKI